MSATIPFVETLRSRFSEFTNSEKKLANHFLANFSSIPFETAASIAKEVGVSQMTVGRFLRTLGYRGLDAVKQEFRKELSDFPWEARFKHFREGRSEDDPNEKSLELEIKALVEVYALARTERWQAISKRIADVDQVFVAGFQATRGLAIDLASHLQYIRPRVTLMDGLNGTYAELLDVRPEEGCVLLVDVRKYAKAAQELAAVAASRGIPLVIVTDLYCYWARDYTQDVLSAPTDVNLYWDSTATMSSLINLLMNSVIGHLESRLPRRLTSVADLQTRFGMFLQ